MPEADLAPGSQPEGFQSGQSVQISLPADYLEVMAALPGSMPLQNLLLGFFSLLSQQEGQPLLVEAFLLRDALDHPKFLGADADFDTLAQQALSLGLLLAFKDPQTGRSWFLPATPQGRELLAQLQTAALQLESLPQAMPGSLGGKPNIFQLYEEHFGPLSPILADELRQDEANYPLEWINDAIREAVLHNARSWKYVQAVLKNWKESGRGPANEKSKEPDSQLEKYLKALRQRPVQKP